VNRVTRHKSAIPYGIAALHGLLDRNSISFVNYIFSHRRKKREKRELGRNPGRTDLNLMLAEYGILENNY
jgi:hypothetical protein